jgi:hypothetical protein
MGRKRQNRLGENVRIAFDLPRRDYLEFLENLPGKFSSISDGLRALIRRFNQQCEER